MLHFRCSYYVRDRSTDIKEDIVALSVHIALFLEQNEEIYSIPARLVVFYKI